MEKEKQRVLPRMVAGVGIMLLLVFLLIKYGFWYASNDDYIRAALLSGAYSGEPCGYTVCMSHLLGKGLACLYRLVPAVPWCGVFFVAVQFYALWVCCKKVAEYFKHWGARILSTLCMLLFFFGLLGYDYVFVQFTVVAAVAAAGSVFLFLQAMKKENGKFGRSDLVHALVLYMLAILVREDVALLHLPFLGLAALYRVLWAGKEKESRQKLFFPLLGVTAGMLLGMLLRNVWIELVCVIFWGVILLLWLIRNWKTVRVAFLEAGAFLGVVVLLLLGSHLVNSQMYHTPEWNSFRAFDEQRIQIIDYSRLPDYDAYKEVYDKYRVSREEYILLVQSGFALSDHLDAELLSQILEDTRVERADPVMDLKRGILNSIRKF